MRFLSPRQFTRMGGRRDAERDHRSRSRVGTACTARRGRAAIEAAGAHRAAKLGTTSGVEGSTGDLVDVDVRASGTVAA